MSNQVSTTNQLYMNIKNEDSVGTVLICSVLRSELVMNPEIEKDILELGL